MKLKVSLILMAYVASAGAAGAFSVNMDEPRVHGADIGGQIGSVVEVVFDDTQTSDDLGTIQAKEPAQFRFSTQISLHALQVGFGGNAPLAVKPVCGRVHQFGFFSQGNIL